MAKAILERQQNKVSGRRDSVQSVARAGSRVEQVQAEYVVSAGRPAAALVAQGAAGAWVLYRNQFLSSSAQTQISEIRKGASASNLIGIAEALRVPRERIERAGPRRGLPPRPRHGDARAHGHASERTRSASRTGIATGRRCSPHSLCSGCSHHQRPARTSSPGATARVHGAQPMLG